MPETQIEQYAEERLRALVPVPAPDANKYTRGKLTLVAGSDAYPGAACLAAAAAQRAGAGYTQVVTAASAAGLVRAWRPSLVVRAFGEWDAASLSQVKTGHPQAVAVGCGFDPGDGALGELALDVLDKAACPVLVDGGALAALGTPRGRALALARGESGRATVATPHGGEAARLARGAGIACEGGDARLAGELARAYGMVCALKGPDTFVSDGSRTFRMPEGTAALAKAGTGDVLAGIIGALLAQGLGPVDACVLGATLHARAGRAAVREKTAVCVIPEDVVEYVPAAVASLL